MQRKSFNFFPNSDVRIHILCWPCLDGKKKFFPRNKQINAIDTHAIIIEFPNPYEMIIIWLNKFKNSSFSNCDDEYGSMKYQQQRKKKQTKMNRQKSTDNSFVLFYRDKFLLCMFFILCHFIAKKKK